jgi:hypothetical protein
MNNSFNGSNTTTQLQTTQPGKTVPHSKYLELGTVKDKRLEAGACTRNNAANTAFTDGLDFLYV